MNDAGPTRREDDQHGMSTIFGAQQAACTRNPFPGAADRLRDLRQLKRQLHRYQDRLADAISRDFGYRAPVESQMTDILGPTLQINHALAHLRRWMRPRRRATELMFKSNSLWVHYQPKGVVGVIVPWNFPVYMALGPLAAALAAGNRVMVKMPESTPATNAVLRCLLAEVFSTDQVALVGEELADPNAFTALPFNHIVFTGSLAVGRIVMRTAAANLTPVTLELGGKSPALVLPGADLHDAARRVAHGKAANGGQTCVAPDYALVPRAGVAAFAEAVQRSFARLVGGNTSGNPDYTALASERHAARFQALLDDARAKGAKVQACAAGGADRQVPLHVVTGTTPDMRVLQEEIFGPILPIVPYDTLDEAIAHVNAGPRPLALYCFGHDAAQRAEVLRRTHSGGVTVNDWAWHAMNHDAPFGGVGNSGMGTYRGEEGFRELSHARTVFKRHRWFPVGLLYPPYSGGMRQLALRLWLGRGDPGLAAVPAAAGATHPARTARAATPSRSETGA